MPQASLKYDNEKFNLDQKCPVRVTDQTNIFAGQNVKFTGQLLSDDRLLFAALESNPKLPDGK